jgi:TPP-dependent 2-oxoacid decarboxylase
LLVFVDACGLPFATMLMDKSVVEEQHPSYIDMLWTSQFGSDLVLNIGAIMMDFSTGDFTAHVIMILSRFTTTYFIASELILYSSMRTMTN